MELGREASDGKDPTGCGIEQIPECCPQTRMEMGLGKVRGETAAPVETGAGGSPGLPATHVGCSDPLPRYPSRGCTDKADLCPPWALQSWGQRPSCAGNREIPKPPFTKSQLSLLLVWVFWGAGDPNSQVHGATPLFLPPCHLPSLPLPSLPARDPLERGWRRAAGAWLPAPPAARAAPAGAGQMAGRAGRILQSGPEEATMRSFCFAAWSFSFRFSVSRASTGLWEREQPWCDGGGV